MRRISWRRLGARGPLLFRKSSTPVILSSAHGHQRSACTQEVCFLLLFSVLSANSVLKSNPSHFAIRMTTFYIQQFGCRATQADGAALERQLLDRGCIAASDPAAASIVVLNTCTVTAAADSQARDAIRKIHAQNPAARLIVTGCYAQRAPEELASLPGVSWVVGNSHKPQIPDLVTQIAPAAANRATQQPTVIPSEARNPLLPLAPPAERHFGGNSHADASLVGAHILAGNIFAHPEFLSAPIQGGESHHSRPILKIQDGCNNRCSFCIIPFVRGKSRSLPPDAVLREIQKLTAENPFDPANPNMRQPILAVSSPAEPALAPLPLHPVHPAHPVREIVLSGINLGTYGRDLNPRVAFIDIIRRILDETPIERLRISSVEPQDVTQDLIDLFASTDRIAHHFHMPLQSASDPVLAAMHRWYRSDHYARRVHLIEDRLPNAALGADVIAGFPSETESDHAATLSFIERHSFTYLHVFSYSPRPGTKAATAFNQVPAPTIKRRARELRALSESKSAAFRRAQQGRTHRVLTLHRDEHSTSERTGGEYTPALSSNYLRVQVPGIHPSNQWQDILITAEEGNYVVGEPASPSTELCAL
jgi:threonylcarbamoyladenosine tRNA methylthiotransferase MtaB